MSSFKEKLKTAMDYRNFSQANLARATNLESSRISQFLAGRNKCKYETAIKIADALNINVQWLMGYEDNMLKREEIISITEDGKIPVYSFIKAGNGDMGIVEGKIESYISVSTDAMRQKHFAIRVIGDSMENDIFDGETAIFRPLEKDEEIKGNGIYAVEVKGWDTWVIRKIIKDPSGSVFLVTSNKNYKPKEVEADKVIVWGKLIETRRTFR